LSDAQYAQNARQSSRERNWFAVDWNLFNASADWKLTPQSNINVLAFGLRATRKSLGFRPNQVDLPDNDTYLRDLITGEFQNYGVEARYLNRYALGSGRKSGVLLLGTRYYHGYNHSVQGFGPKGRGADFRFVGPEGVTFANGFSDFEFPNQNVAVFAENILYLSDKVSVTPGVRYEYIRTTSKGTYGTVIRDNAGNIDAITQNNEQRLSPRGFVLGGIGISYKPVETRELYGNISQNYRSITFSDMRIANPSAVIDPNLQDERGYSADLGLRGEQGQWLTYDVSLFVLQYGNRIGEVQTYDAADRVLRRRSNVGRALILGVESYAEVDLLRALRPPAEPGRWTLASFGNLALIRGRYTQSEITGVKGNEVEFVPAINLKAGARAGYGPFKGSVQFTHLSQQYSDATNAKQGGVSAVVGLIPAYTVLDASVSWERRWLKLEGSVNNLADAVYFTRRATGYPGPGILPSDGRSFFLTAAVKW
jgi:Fe(3+) dicitrate transport protein